MTHTPELRVSEDKSALLTDVTAATNQLLSHLLQTRVEINIVLTGGSVGVALLTDVDPTNGWDWSRIHLWWGDERWLPANDSDRNDKQAHDALIHRLPIPRENVHLMAAADSGMSLDQAATVYENLLIDHFDGAQIPQFTPRFDLIFLGVGPDAHVASLFPGLPEITETDKLVVPVRNSPKPPPERISLTLKAINASERIWIVASGADKAHAISRALKSPSESAPVSMVHGRFETVIFADAAAAHSEQ